MHKPGVDQKILLLYFGNRSEYLAGLEYFGEEKYNAYSQHGLHKQNLDRLPTVL